MKVDKSVDDTMLSEDLSELDDMILPPMILDPDFEQ